MQEVERLNSIGHDMEFVVHLVELERLPDQEDVTGVASTSRTTITLNVVSTVFEILLGGRCRSLAEPTHSVPLVPKRDCVVVTVTPPIHGRRRTHGSGRQRTNLAARP